MVPNLYDLAWADPDDRLVAFLGDRSQKGLALHGAVALLLLALGHDDVQLIAVQAGQGPGLEGDLERPFPGPRIHHDAGLTRPVRVACRKALRAAGRWGSSKNRTRSWPMRPGGSWPNNDAMSSFTNTTRPAPSSTPSPTGVPAGMPPLHIYRNRLSTDRAPDALV